MYINKTSEGTKIIWKTDNKWSSKNTKTDMISFFSDISVNVAEVCVMETVRELHSVTQINKYLLQLVFIHT